MPRPITHRPIRPIQYTSIHRSRTSYSTAFLSKALPPEGQIDTIELSPEHARIAKQNFLEADLFPFPAVHVGPALDILRDPQGPFASANLPGSQEGEKDPGYDVCFVDADKEKVMEYWMECLRVTRRGGVIVLDNAVRGGR
jgi:predicted O-methyltransferase YrrM